jgi:hypothetical protein
MLQTPRIQRERSFSGGDLLFLGLLSAAGFAVGLRGISHYGYIGQDFVYNRDGILSFSQSFSYSKTNPPGFYWFGSFIHNHVSSAHYLETIALGYLIFNSLALWIFYEFFWRGISAWQLRYAAAAFATFVPFRVIHAVVLASDAFTVPVFALVACFTLRLFENPRSVRSWAGISLSLSVGLLCKYTFVGLLPPIALLLAIAIPRRLPKGARLLWGGIGILALALPTGVVTLQLVEAASVNSYHLSRKPWLPKDLPPAMRWSDMLTLQKSDLGLLSAPDYYGGALYGFRTYSYVGLLHVSSFTDVLECFQPPPRMGSTDWNKTTEDPIQRRRSPLSQFLQIVAVRWCIVFSALAIAGTLFCVVLSSLSLLLGMPLLADATVVVTALATGFYLPVFLSLHELTNPYASGYWLPRLILPALLVFFSLGFVMLDLGCKHLERLGRAPNRCLWLFSGFTLAVCLLFIGFLS